MSLCTRACAWGSGQPGTAAQPDWALPWGLCFRHPDAHHPTFHFGAEGHLFTSTANVSIVDLRDNSFGSSLLTVKILRVWHSAVSARGAGIWTGAEREFLTPPRLNLKFRHLSMSSVCSQGAETELLTEFLTILTEPGGQWGSHMWAHPLQWPGFTSALNTGIQAEEKASLGPTYDSVSSKSFTSLLSIHKWCLYPYGLSSNRNFHIYYPSSHRIAVDNVLATTVFQMWLFLWDFSLSHIICTSSDWRLKK